MHHVIWKIKLVTKIPKHLYFLELCIFRILRTFYTLIKSLFCEKKIMSPVLAYGGSDSKASVYNVGDPGLIPGLGRSPGEGNGNSLQYYCLENPMYGGAC